MPTVEESITINAPRQAAWDFTSDPANWTVWQSNIVESEVLTEGPVRQGTRARGASRVVGRTVEWTAEITDWEPGEKTEFTSDDSPIPFVFTMTFRDIEGGCEVTVRQESGSYGGFFGSLADPLVNRIYSRDVASNLAKLKDLLEH